MRVDFVQKTVGCSKSENRPRYTYEPPTDEEIQEYHAREYPNWIKACQTTFQSLHEHVDADQPVRRLEWLMTNEGTRPAHNLRIEFEAKGVKIRRNDVKREQSHPDPAGQFRPKKKNLPALPKAPIPPAFRKVRILAETGSQSPSTGIDISTLKGGLATNEVRRAINSLHAGEIDVSKLLGLDASLFSSDPELKRGLMDFGQQFAQDEAARRALFTPASHYTLPTLPKFPKPDDPETFYYEDWDNSRPTEAGALTCTLYRHGGKPEGFDFDVAFRGEGAQRGSVQCTVHAENLSQPVKHAIDVVRKSELFSIMPIARQLIEGLK